jgi:hypothetical protein
MLMAKRCAAALAVGLLYPLRLAFSLLLWPYVFIDELYVDALEFLIHTRNAAQDGK